MVLLGSKRSVNEPVPWIDDDVRLNQAFGIGRHLAFRCHFEVTEDIVREW